MTPVNEMSPEQRLWCKKLILILVDAIDGPMGYQPTEFYMAEYDARERSGKLIETLNPEFTFCCDVVDADPIRLREKFMDGELDRGALMEFYTRLGRE